MVQRASLDLKRLFVGALLLLAGCRETAGLNVDFKTSKRELPNGVTLLMIEDHSVPIVSFQTWVRVGSVDEVYGKTGLAHLFEHLMFPKEFVTRLESIGAEVNAMTTRDYTVFYENFHPKYLDEVMSLEVSRFEKTRFDEQTLLTEKAVVLEERKMRIENSPSGKAQEALWGLAFQRHPYRYPVSGLPADVLNLKLSDLNDFFATHYHGGNTVIVVSGDFSPPKLEPRLVAAYSKLPKGRRATRDLPLEPEQNGERLLDLHDSVVSTEVHIGYPITSAADPDTHALDVLSTLLLNGVNSRLYKDLVQERQVYLSLQGFAFTPLYPGLFLISGTLRAGVTPDQALKALDESLKAFQEGPLDEAEVKVAAKQLTLQVVDGMRTAYGVGQLFGLMEAIFFDYGKVKEEVLKYWDVTPSQVKRAAKKYLHPNRRNVVRMFPASAAALNPRKGKTR